MTAMIEMSPAGPAPDGPVLAGTLVAASGSLGTSLGAARVSTVEDGAAATVDAGVVGSGVVAGASGTVVDGTVVVVVVVLVGVVVVGGTVTSTDVLEDGGSSAAVSAGTGSVVVGVVAASVPSVASATEGSATIGTVANARPSLVSGRRRRRRDHM